MLVLDHIDIENISFFKTFFEIFVTLKWLVFRFFYAVELIEELTHNRELLVINHMNHFVVSFVITFLSGLFRESSCGSFIERFLEQFTQISTISDEDTVDEIRDSLFGSCTEET